MVDGFLPGLDVIDHDCGRELLWRWVDRCFKSKDEEALKDR